MTVEKTNEYDGVIQGKFIIAFQSGDFTHKCWYVRLDQIVKITEHNNWTRFWIDQKTQFYTEIQIHNLVKAINGQGRHYELYEKMDANKNVVERI